MCNQGNREIHELNPGQWISIGENNALDAVFVRSFDEGHPSDIEVVFIDRRDRAIARNASWNGDYWELDGPDATYADNSDRLDRFVRLARAGRY